ncbi:MAG: cell division protein FtsA [Pseudomonadota bacterium]
MDSIACIDIGSSEIVALMGQQDPISGQCIVAGLGRSPTAGMKKGLIVDLDAMGLSIQRAVEEAEAAAGAQMHMPLVCLPSIPCQSHRSFGACAIRENRVSRSEIEQVVAGARATPMSADHQMIHEFSKGFTVDHQAGIRDPLGLSGVRLEAEMYLVSCDQHALSNVKQCLAQCGLETNKFVVAGIAAGFSATTLDERQLGVGVIDIGAGSIDLVLFEAGTVQLAVSIPLAGQQITNDIAMAFRIPTINAEEVKRKFGHAWVDKASPVELMKLEASWDRARISISQRALAEIIEPRLEELLLLLKRQISHEKLSALSAGILLTGSASQIPGLVELSQTVLNIPVRIAVSKMIVDGKEIKDPRLAAVIGAAECYRVGNQSLSNANSSSAHFGAWVDRMQTWLRKTF